MSPALSQEMKPQKNYTTQNVASYTVFYQENGPKMTSKYPFLTADQINCRLRDQWKKLAKKEKKNFSIPKVCVTPSKVNTGIKKKVTDETEHQELNKCTPNKSNFPEENPSIASLMLSKSLKQKSVADWLDTNKQKLAETKTYSGVVNPVKDIPEVYDRTPHLKTGILKNTERSVSLEKSRQEGRTPAKVTFTPINKKGRKLPITNRFTDDSKTFDESKSMDYIQPKNLKHDFEIDEGRDSEVKSYTCDFDDGGDEDECNKIDRDEYSDSDDDYLLHYLHENDEEDTQQTEESDPRTPISKAVSQTCENTDQIVSNSSDASSEICTTASSTTKASKAQKPLKNGLITPSQSKRTLRPRKRNTTQEEPVVEIPSFEKGISPKMFGLHKERRSKRQAKQLNGDLNYQQKKQHNISEDNKLETEDLKGCQVADVNKLKEMDTECVRKSDETNKTGRKGKQKYKDLKGCQVADVNKLKEMDTECVRKVDETNKAGRKGKQKDKDLKGCQVADVNKLKEMDTECVRKADETNKTGRKGRQKDKDLKGCQVADVNKLKEMDTECVRKSDETNKNSRNGKQKDDDITADEEEMGCHRTAKRITRNKKPVYEDSNLRESGDFDDFGYITSKKKMKIKVLPGLFDNYDIELTSKEECIKNQDKLISEFPAFQHCENNKKIDQKDELKSGIAYNLKKLTTEKLQDKNELGATIKLTPQKTIPKKKEKEIPNLNNNNKLMDHDFENMDRVLKDLDKPINKVNQDSVDINNNSSENLDEKEDTSLVGLKALTNTFKMGKPDSFSSSYDDDFEDVEDQPSCSNGNNTLQKILCNLRKIGTQSSVDDEEGNILDVDDEPMDVEESPKLLSPTLSGVSELSSVSEIEHQPGKNKKDLQGRKQPSRVKRGKGSETEDLQDEEPECHDVNNKVIPRGEICKMFDEIPPPLKKTKKSKDRRFVASNQQAGISNFGVLFHEEDIFL